MIITPVKFDAFEICGAQSAVGFVTVPAFSLSSSSKPCPGYVTMMDLERVHMSPRAEALAPV